MQGDENILKHLNQILYNELTAVNQYFLHYKMMQNWGYQKLAQHEYEESLEEMRHADQLATRILLLQGLPNFQKLGGLQIGENVPEVLSCDLALEVAGRKDLQDAIAGCEAARDYVSAKLCRSILDAEETHIDWLETQLELIKNLGEANYLQRQIGSDDA